jgi:hypothetical protein
LLALFLELQMLDKWRNKHSRRNAIFHKSAPIFAIISLSCQYINHCSLYLEALGALLSFLLKWNTEIQCHVHPIKSAVLYFCMWLGSSKKTSYRPVHQSWLSKSLMSTPLIFLAKALMDCRGPVPYPVLYIIYCAVYLGLPG